MEQLYEINEPVEPIPDIDPSDSLKYLEKDLEMIVNQQLYLGVMGSLKIMLDNGIIKLFDPETKKKLSKKKAKKLIYKWIDEYDEWYYKELLNNGKQ